MTLSSIIAALFRKIGNVFIRLSKELYQSSAERRVLPWNNIKGDKTLRLRYPLHKSSVVFDVGGYEGQWASDVVAMYNCAVHVFEPVPFFARNIRDRFAGNSNVKVYDFGLSGKNEKVQIVLAADSSSTIRGGNAKKEDIFLVDVVSFLNKTKISQVDLIKINIEGGEYELLERLISSGKIKIMKNIQVQFHDFVPGAFERMSKIQEALSKTHRPTYQYEFVWESWELIGK